MAGAHFEEDPNFRGELLRSAEIRAVLEEKATAAAKTASRLAPDDPRTSGADLHSSIVADVELTARGYAARVAALDFKAGWYEFGSSRTRARPFLRPAVEEEVGPLESGGGGEGE